MPSDGLFIVGSGNFDRAMALGMYPAMAYLVLARGTQKNNLTTAWSAKSVKGAVGVRWQKCHDAIEVLANAGLLTRTNFCKGRPRYRLAEFEGDKVFLPNSLVDGLDNGTAPLRRIREAQNPDILKLLIDFYRLQNLASEHGVNRDWLHKPADVDFIMEMGQFLVWAATPEHKYVADWAGDLTKPWHGDELRFWEALRALDALGLIELAWYVTDADGELLYPYSLDVMDATIAYIEAHEIDSRPSWPGEKHFLTRRHQANPQFIGVYRVRFRTPHTSMTGEWSADVVAMQNHMIQAMKL